VRFDTVLQMVGNTPHVRVHTREAREARLYIKLEGCNPTGSVKDRACVRMIQKSIDHGALRPGMTLLDASSGNMACAIAYYGRLLGYPSELVVSSKLTAEKQNFLLYFGATLRKVGDFTIEGNQFCRELVETRRPNPYCFLDQLHNWENPRASYETLGAEVLADFPDVAAVVGSLGSGGSLLGTAQRIKEACPGAHVVAVQAAAGTRLPGTGSFDEGDYVTPFIRKGMDEGIFNQIVKIREQDAVRRVREVREQGIFCGLQTGGVLHAALTVIAEQRLAGDVVVISGDSGWKNMDKLMHLPCA
jgi:[CysO sulfur-carrier protein]-thiocarboxylate-dependent cysteine synthase